MPLSIDRGIILQTESLISRTISKRNHLRTELLISRAISKRHYLHLYYMQISQKNQSLILQIQ